MSEVSSSQIILSQTVCELGEGPSFERETNTLWWFDILGKTLHERDLLSGRELHHPLPFLASVVARIDDERQLLGTEKGIYIRRRSDGELTPYVELEPGETTNRSNDGRLHPSGSLWIGTMGKKAEQGAGAIYHVAEGKVTKLFSGISIPNGICFSPDGTTGYFVDTKVNHLMRVSLDPSTGLPAGEASLLVDTSDRPGGMDGAVSDRNGNIWNARWGEGAVDCYAPDGQLLRSIAIPARLTTCPVFYGAGFDRIAITSAWEGLSPEERREDPLAGKLFALPTDVEGVPEPAFRL